MCLFKALNKQAALHPSCFALMIEIAQAAANGPNVLAAGYQGVTL